MPLNLENEIRLGKAGVFFTKANCVPLSVLTAPVVSGTESVGSTLSCSNGTYNGSTPITYSYSWRSTLNPSIPIGTSSTYVIQSGDAGYRLYCIVTASNCGGSINTQSNQTGVIPAPFTYLFDIFAAQGVTPRAAYSFRKLNSAYAGACCRIRRDSDNAEIDINFVSNVVDTAAIDAFVPLGVVGHIVYIYDQSGNNRHRYQSVANRQPHIKSIGGTIFTFNGKVAARFNNINHMLQQSTTILPPNANYSAFNVYNETNASDNILFVGGTNQFAYVSSSGSGASAYGFFTPLLNKVNDISVTINTRAQSYTNLSNKGNVIGHYADFTLATGWGSANFGFGGYNNFGGGFAWLGYYMEEIYCDGSNVSNATLSANVFANQQTYYGL